MNETATEESKFIHRYVVTVRETIDVQYILNNPSPLMDEHITGESLKAAVMVGQAERIEMTANTREIEIHSIDALPPVKP
jgi:hypothetical protein